MYPKYSLRKILSVAATLPSDQMPQRLMILSTSLNWPEIPNRFRVSLVIVAIAPGMSCVWTSCNPACSNKFTHPTNVSGRSFSGSASLNFRPSVARSFQYRSLMPTRSTPVPLILAIYVTNHGGNVINSVNLQS